MAGPVRGAALYRYRSPRGAPSGSAARGLSAPPATRRAPIRGGFGDPYVENTGSQGSATAFGQRRP